MGCINNISIWGCVSTILIGKYNFIEFELLQSGVFVKSDHDRTFIYVIPTKITLQRQFQVQVINSLACSITEKSFY